MRPALLLAAAVSLSAAGCTTMAPVNPLLSVPKESATDCAAHCGRLDMRLGAVVIVRDSVGCVCQPKDQPPRVGGGEGESAVAGGVLAVLDLEAERRQREQEEAQRRSLAGTPKPILPKPILP